MAYLQRKILINPQLYQKNFNKHLSESDKSIRQKINTVIEDFNYVINKLDLIEPDRTLHPMIIENIHSFQGHSDIKKCNHTLASHTNELS